AAADLARGKLRAREGAREPARDVERVDALEACELLVGREEVLRRRLRGGRQLRRCAEARVELLRPELDVVAVALVAEADVERDDAPVREAARRPGTSLEHGGRRLHAVDPR